MTLSLANLSIKKKIHIVTVITSVILFIILLNNYVTLVDNEESLQEMSDISYQVVQVATANKYLIEKLDEQYTQSVTFGDEELLTKASETSDAINKNLKRLNQLDHAYNTNKEQEQLAAYNNTATNIAQGMIAGTADFSKIQEDAKQKTEHYEALLASFAAIQKQSDLRFIELIDSTMARSHRSLIIGIAVTVTSLIIIISLAIYIATSIGESAKEVANSLGQLADGGGSLSSQLTVRGTDEIGRVSKNFNGFVSLLKGAVENVIAVVAPLTESSTQLVRDMERAETATNKQSQDAEVVKQSMEEMKFSVSDISSSAASAAAAAEEAEREVEISKKQISRSVKESSQLSNEIDAAAVTIDKLASDTQNVGQILNVITSIAEQTNLLALNAAIEAARAGEQGRGFAVVADEVRELASRTAKSTNEIRELLNALTVAADDSVKAMNQAMEMARNNAQSAEKTGQSIEKISDQILSINTMNAQIATATEEQTSVASIVVDNVSNMHESFQSTLQSLNEVREVAGNLHQLSDSLTNATDKFSVN